METKKSKRDSQEIQKKQNKSFMKKIKKKRTQYNINQLYAGQRLILFIYIVTL